LWDVERETLRTDIVSCKCKVHVSHRVR
jgi:hypothetical protein